MSVSVTILATRIHFDRGNENSMNHFCQELSLLVVFVTVVIAIINPLFQLLITKF